MPGGGVPISNTRSRPAPSTVVNAAPSPWIESGGTMSRSPLTAASSPVPASESA